MTEKPWPSPRVAWYAVGVLTVAYVFSFIDRTIIALLVEPIKADLGLSDTQIGILHGFAFVIFYTLVGLPIGWLADRKRRNLIIAAGIFVWSLMTAACGLARNFWQLFAARVGVGVGEAALSPPAYSMIADYFPPERLGRALGVYSSGIFLGVGAAFIVGGAVVQFFSGAPPVELPIVGSVKPWQLAFVAVGLPGVLVALLMLTVREPDRRGRGAATDDAPSVRALFGFMKSRRAALLAHFFGFAFIGLPVQAMFAWTPTYLIRVFDFSPGQAGLAMGLVALICGASGMVCGGWLTDWFRSRGQLDGPLRTGLVTAVCAVPFAATATLAGSWQLAIVMLAFLVFFCTCSVGAAPAGLQLVTPNRFRAQASAVYMLVLNMIASGAGPALTALATDYVFMDTAAVGKSLALVSGCSAPIAVLIFAVGLRSFGRAVEEMTTG
ncbi:MAG: MFS transporter [Gammaproteobacteria bacterium]|nr:MFS transporter [Gammaproteobacteria bacterium]